jgi:FkbM family methyltransferase
MLDIWHKLKEHKGQIVLYGMGNGAEIMVKQLEKYGITVDGFFASDDFVRGQSFMGKRVMTFKEAKEKFPDMIALVSFGTQRQEVIDNILSLDVPVFAPEVPVVGETVFTYDFLKANEEKIRKVYSLLSDELSKKVFEQIIYFKLDGDINHLINAESDADEMLSLFSLSDNESYLDLGAYNGDTVLDFIKRVNGYKHITAVEPDIKNFKKLMKNTEGIKNITLVNKAVSDKEENVLFSAQGGRNSRVGEGKIIEATSIDALNEDFTFIKMDVEGNESKAVSGGIRQIKRGCKMLISAYHRSEDIFEIPLTVHSINPEYKISLRHLKYIPAWDTNCCFTL